MTTQLTKRVKHSGGIIGLTTSVWGRVWGLVWGNTWGGSLSSQSAHPTVDITKRVTGLITETSTKRVAGVITELSTKRVPVEGGSQAGVSSGTLGQTWGDVFGATWGGGPTSVSIHPTVEVTKRVTGAIAETSTKRVPKVDAPEFV